MTRRNFLATASAVTATASATNGDRPNLIFIMPDQWRGQALGCLGDPNARTPNLDKLAAGGLLMRNVIANTPVCCPARSVILTGRYTHANGMTANDLRLRLSEPSYAEVMRQAGYKTGFIGKWHIDGGVRMPGYVPPERRRGFTWWAANQCNHNHFKSLYFRGDSSEAIAMTKFEVEGWMDLGVEFLREAAREKSPFFLTVQMGPPHDPYKAPGEYSTKYDAARLKLRDNYREAERVPGRGSIAEYYAMIESIDDQMGRLMKTLEDLSLLDNTIVFFSSDHGDMLGSQGERLKRKPWEESISVPGIWWNPKLIGRGRTSDAIFSHVDFAPTFLGLCGLKAPASMQGVDHTRVITGKRMQLRDAALLQIFGPFAGDGTKAGWRGVRTATHTYARYEKEPWMLHDNQRDPFQMKNLAGSREHVPLQAKLEKRLNQMMQANEDSWSRNWTHPVEDGGRLYKDRAFDSVEQYLQTLPK